LEFIKENQVFLTTCTRKILTDGAEQNKRKKDDTLPADGNIFNGFLFSYC
jgi:hypothetical protein